MGEDRNGRMFHVLYVLNDLSRGGAELYVERLASEVARMGITATIAAGSSRSVQVSSLAPSVGFLPVPFRRAKGSLALHVLNSSGMFPRLLRYMKSHRVHLVHTHLIASAIPAWVAARMLCIPVVHTMMHVASVASPMERLVLRSPLGRLLGVRFHAFSSYLAQQLKDVFCVPEEHVSVIPPGIDTSRYRPRDSRSSRRQFGIPENAFVIGVCARLYPEKGVDLAIRAYLALESQKATMLVIAGEGPEREQLERLATSEAQGGSVLFLGHVPDTERLFPAFDLYLQTTRGPHLGFSVLEALACGVPVLVAVRDAEEERMAKATLIDPGCGEVVSAELRTIAARIQKLMADTGRLTRMKVTARHVAEQYFSWSGHVQAMRSLYALLVTERFEAPARAKHTD